MIIIAGLGNPGKEYSLTRHNLGFMVLDAIKNEGSFSDFKTEKKINVLISKKNNAILAKPLTFMNNSGDSIIPLMNYYNTSSLILIHDDIDIPFGEMKISTNRGAAGHKGVESVIKKLGNKNFTRFRIGIKPKNNHPVNTESFVLKKFKKEEMDFLGEIILKAAKEVLKKLD